MKKQYFSFILLLVFTHQGLASSVRSENANAPTQWSSALKLEQDVNTDRPNRPLRDFGLGYTYSSTQPDSYAGQSNWIQTNSENLNLDWKYGKEQRWYTTFDLNLSDQPAEKFTANGFEIDLGYKIDLRDWAVKNDKENTESFAPSLSLGIKVGDTSLTQKGKTQIGRTTINDLTEPQVLTGVDVRLDWFEFLSFEYIYDGYSYSKTIGAFTAYLNNNGHSVANPAMATALGQLNVFDSTLKALIYFNDNWELDLSYETMDGLTTGINSSIYQAMVIWQINKEYGLEFGGNQSQPTNDYTAMINLSYSY